MVKPGLPLRETTHLWLATWILLALSAYRLTTQLSTPLRQFLDTHSSLPLAEIFENVLFFWLLALLWTAYQRWHQAIYQKRELERVVSGISPDALMVINPDREIVMCNDAVKQMFGYEPRELVGRQTDLLYFDRRITGEKHELFKYLERVGFHVGCATGRRKDGSTFPLEIITGSIRHQQGVVILIRDITDRRKAETALRESEERFALFMRHLPACVFIKDDAGRLIYLNAACEAGLGWPAATSQGKTNAALLPPALVAQHDAEDRLVLRAGETLHRIDELPRAGELRVFDTFKFPIPHDEHPLLGCIAVDITERRRTEEERRRLEMQMLQAQKLESLGLLGGGIAHDFNNLLAGILGYSDLALAELSPGTSLHNYLTEVVAASKRAAELCNQLLAYSGQGRFVVEVVDLSNVVREMIHLLEVSISKKARLSYELAPDLPAIECDTTQIRQVVMNLIVNASDALQDRPGEIRISTAVRQLDREALRHTYLGEHLPAGPYNCLSVTDTGCGMDELTRAQIFDPFFSTKFTGRGLGLAAVMGIIRGHNGAIEVITALNSGTTFSVFLPVSNKTVLAADTALETPAAWMGSGTVLVVDDEEIVRGIAESMLQKLGFQVLTAANGQDALTVIYERHAELAAVLLDMTMPVFSGVEVFRELRRKNIRVPLVFTSGYNKQQEVDLIPTSEALVFLQKPYRLDAMRETFRNLLTARPPV